MPAQKSLRRRAEKPPQHRCPGCRYFHDGSEAICTTCQAQAGSNGLLLAEGASLLATAMPLSEPSAPPVVLDGDTTQSTDGPVPRVQPSRGPRVCPCCTHPQRIELDVALYSPRETLHGIAAKFQSTVYAVTQHRRMCLGIPPLTLHERGRRTQFLRKINERAAVGEPASLFSTHVVKELLRVETDLEQNARHLAVLQDRQTQLQRQAQCLRGYLQLVTTIPVEPVESET